MGDSGTIDELRLVGIPGTNKVMAGELSRLAGRAFDGFRLPTPRKEGPGILVYPFDAPTAALAVRYHRTASRVLWSLFQSSATKLEPLYGDLLEAMKREKRGWFRRGASISVSVSNVGGFAAGGRQIVGVVKNAVIDGAGRQGVPLQVNADAPDISLVARLHDETVTVSIDLAGRPMNQRGYRREPGKAPMRENLAAALVMLSRYDPRREALVDPMAGSGTIAIEGACMARGMQVWTAPRAPSAESLPPFKTLMADPPDPLFGDTEPLVFANEIDARIHKHSRGNAARAGVGKFVELRCGHFMDLKADAVREMVRKKGMDPDRGVILSNPPYGERVKKRELQKLYRELGGWCRKFPGWRAAFLVANPEFEAAFGGIPRIKKPLRNGPLNGYFYLYDL